MFCFRILRNYGGNRKKEKKLENLGIIELLRRSVGNPRRDVDLCQGGAKMAPLGCAMA